MGSGGDGEGGTGEPRWVARTELQHVRRAGGGGSVWGGVAIRGGQWGEDGEERVLLLWAEVVRITGWT